MLIGLSVAPLSYAGGLMLKSEDAFAPVVNAIAMPLLLLSGILLPMALAPGWLQFLSNINPLTHAVDAARALFNADWGNPDIAIGVTISAIFAVFAVWVGSRAFTPRGRLSASRDASGPGPAGLQRKVWRASPGLYGRRPNADQVSSTETSESHIRSLPSSGCQPLSRVRSVWIFELPFG